MDTPITHAEQTQFEKAIDAELKRLSDEDNRQNRRIDALEESVKQFGTLATSVEKLSVNMESMVKEQERQGIRLETLEKRDGEKWRSVAGYVTTAVIGLLIGFICRQIGLA